MSDLEKAIKGYLGGLKAPPKFGDLEKDFDAAIRALAASGDVPLGDDKNLTSGGLEVRTKLLFERLGFEVVAGRSKQEDFVMRRGQAAGVDEPIVLEVKSARGFVVDRENLRQLDDWVFDLSGEETARKEGLGGGFDGLAMVTDGLVTSQHRHPSPHKGVMVFNGPVGTKFDQRPAICISSNDQDFVVKRNFCVVSFGTLIAYEAAFAVDNLVPARLWERLHATAGMLAPP